MSTDPSNLVPPGTTYIPTTSSGNVGYMVMSYPGRPQMVPGIPMPPGMGMYGMPIGGPGPLMPAVMPMAHPHMMAGPPMAPMPAPPTLRTYRPPTHHNAPPRTTTPSTTTTSTTNLTTTTATTTTSSSTISRPVKQQLPPVAPVAPTGPIVTVFVGNITDKAPDQMIRHILAACGHVVSWKRVQAFGFCEYGSPDGGLRAIRILHEMEIGGKKLVVKVDPKTKTLLDEFKAEKRKKVKGHSPLQDEPEEEDDYMDETMKNSDKIANERIMTILMDYDSDMKYYSMPKSERSKNPADMERRVGGIQRVTTLTDPTSKDSDSNSLLDLDDANIEEGKRDLITREIGKFREIMKKQEEEKELERRRREEVKKERREDSPTPNGRDRDRDRERDRDRDRGRSHDSRSSRGSRSISPEHKRHKSRHHTRSRSRDRDREREKEREWERERERDRERDRDREREQRERDDRKPEKDVLREKEEEEEQKEKRKLERKAREKEAAYQERLRQWENRERHKAKELMREKEKKRIKEDEKEKEAKRLKEFLEDYDDERDDIKYYKGRELQRRLEERAKEMEMDARDRQKEKEELEELRAKIYASGDGADPETEYAKALKAREELYKPKLVIDVNLEHEKQREKERERELEKEREKEREAEREREAKQKEKEAADLEELRKRAVQLAEAQAEAERALMMETDSVSQPSASPGPSPPSHSPPPLPEPVHHEHQESKMGVTKSWTSPAAEKEKKKKKLDVKEVFNTDDDDDSNLGTKKRKLVPLDYTEDKKKVKDDKKEDLVKTQEEKRKHIKTLIDKIPTDKNALFAFQLDWAAVDNQFLERRIRPWINKKIIEYIGEPEPTLVDFICSKVLAGSAPQGILDDVQMVLDEEAEVFVVKMWRLLIYEIEAKKLGLK